MQSLQIIFFKKRLSWTLITFIFISSFILISCEEEATPKELAKIYCDCVGQRDSIKGQLKYIQCHDKLSKKSSLYKHWLKMRNSDTVNLRRSTIDDKADKFVNEMLLEVDKICPGK
jgi:hypothetical protein